MHVDSYALVRRYSMCYSIINDKDPYEVHVAIMNNWHNIVGHVPQ